MNAGFCVTATATSHVPTGYRCYSQYRAVWQRSARKKGHPLEKFRRIARVILVCISWCRFSYQRAEERKDEFLSLAQYHDQPNQTVDGQELLFDLSYFKVKQAERIPQEAKRILQKQPERRTEKELKYLLIMLRTIKSFSEYPIRMQKRMCSVSWYEGYESKRAIVRQGHPPSAFYFILSGTVVITVLEENSHVPRTICFLHRGMEFGELALISRSIRQATVVSKTAVELLCISLEDFEEIFMSGGMKNVNDPDHNKFLRSVPFLRMYPLDKLAQEACVFHFFSRGQVLVRDSSYSDWIYIVKSGSVSVLKKLRRVDRKRKNPEDEKDNVSDKASSSSLTKISSPRQRKKSKTKSLDNLDEKGEVPISTRDLGKTLPGLYNKDDRMGLIDYDTVIQEYEKHNIDEETELEEANDNVLRLPIINQTRTPSAPSSAGSPEAQVQITENEIVKLPEIGPTTKGVYFSQSRKRKKNVEEHVKYKEDNFVLVSGRKTIADDLDNKPVKIHELTEADLYPEFIEVQVLERGQYFGVSSLVFPEQPSLSLVSNGADCILISKKAFMEHCDEKMMRYLRKTEIPYQTDDEMQQKLKEQVGWEFHRNVTYSKTAQKVMNLRSRKKSNRPQYAGQYNFRTGPFA
ncbi:uncharacterized protein LOC106178564 isoform X2 [Lingula anatina]|uniref:Uncharacterized protein LOC106178564 isoform X2 n=1 Tax=Lingula anatina TaxID=7574 RepID=A0A1S3K4R0_LINAN|nr:uncharacterized protein LOC106178564 isoform X2 [Lingula anatina]|eukprot:XP_013417241.1 uncharacterized protein LOC106178564 isoform X2 [Lingula anatina]